MCCGSKSSREVTLWAVLHSLWFSDHKPWTTKVVEDIPLLPTVTYPLAAFSWALLRVVSPRLHQRRDVGPRAVLIQPPSPAQGPLRDREVRRSQCPDCMTGAQSSQHRLSPAMPTFYFPNIGLKHILSTQSYILDAATNILTPKAVNDQQIPTVKGGSDEIGTGNVLMMLREEFKKQPQLL